ncbi:gamma-glutamyltransferase, partial [Synechocystis sp. LEGE 06083]
MADKTIGVVAAGHAQTAEAGKRMLEEGGNAFDAAIASVLAACVVESGLTSLGGGGFLLAQTAAKKSYLFDFFCQTPLVNPGEKAVDFYP